MVLLEAKRRSGRAERLRDSRVDYLWYPGKKRAKRFIDDTFGKEDSALFEHFVV